MGWATSGPRVTISTAFPYLSLTISIFVIPQGRMSPDTTNQVNGQGSQSNASCQEDRMVNRRQPPSTYQAMGFFQCLCWYTLLDEGWSYRFDHDLSPEFHVRPFSCFAHLPKGLRDCHGVHSQIYARPMEPCAVYVKPIKFEWIA